MRHNWILKCVFAWECRHILYVHRPLVFNTLQRAEKSRVGLVMQGTRQYVLAGAVVPFNLLSLAVIVCPGYKARHRPQWTQCPHPPPWMQIYHNHDKCHHLGLPHAFTSPHASIEPRPASASPIQIWSNGWVEETRLGAEWISCFLHFPPPL